MYLLSNKSQAIGFLKIGKKKLFIRDEKGTISEINPKCVLDFYVNEKCQRSGYGKVKLTIIL